MGLAKYPLLPFNSATTFLKAGNREKARHPTLPTWHITQRCALSGHRVKAAADFQLAGCGRHGHEAENHQLTKKTQKLLSQRGPQAVDNLDKDALGDQLLPSPAGWWRG